ncbi:unnamed protein product [Brassica rapa subsp. trilocularis]
MVSLFSSKKGSKESKNPYSNRGLDKFSALLSELDEKRQNIYAKRVDSHGPPLVRFVFKSSGECVPVMIKTKKGPKKKDDVQDDLVVKTESNTKEEKEIKPEAREHKQRCVLKENLKKFSRPNHFLPLTAILVLIFLVFFGRSITIMCTCIVWYLIPIIKEQSRKKGSTNKTKKKNNKKTNTENGASLNKKMACDQTVLKDKYPHVAAPCQTTR